jgi:biopolymer transport protein ExbD
MKLDRFREPPETPSFPLTAMIDVLFLMVIFLVLGANFDPVASVKLPEARGGAVGPAMLRVELTADGNLLFEGQSFGPEAALKSLRAIAPRSILLLPDRRLSVERLFRWYDLLAGELEVPVSVGVLPPSTQ